MQAFHIALMVVAGCVCFSNGQSFSFTFGTDVGPETVTSQTPAVTPATRTIKSPVRTVQSSHKQPQPSAINEIGKSPCPRGVRGFACRQQLALDALTCTESQCRRCRQGCSTLSPNEWPTCCRDHFLCCRQLASACQQCDTPQLLPFCTAAFKRCS